MLPRILAPALIKTLCPPSDADHRFAGATEGDRLHNRHIIVHHRGLTDHNAGRDRASAPYLGARRVNIHAKA